MMTSEEQQSTVAYSFTNTVSVEIEQQNPWKDDRLNRKASSELLTKLLNNAHSPFTLVVNSPWGTGKTFFIERWHAAIKQEHFAFYFSAWEAEIHPMPMLAFLQGLQGTFNEDKELSSVTDDITNLVMKFIAFKVALPLIIDSIVSGAGYLAAGTDVINKFVGVGKELAEDKIKKAFDEPPRTVNSIRESFQSIIETICDKSSKQKPIYIFIDELDRCRPDFAIRFLEEVKHIFSVANIVFVLSLDLEQLEGSIKHVYGAHINCEGYLRKFVNQFYNLPTIPHLHFTEKLFENFNHSKFSSIIGNQRDINSYFAKFSDSFNISLRGMESIFSKYHALAHTAPDNSIFPITALYFMFVQTKYPELWRSCIQKREFHAISSEQLNEKEKLRNWKTRDNSPSIMDIKIRLACKGQYLSNADLNIVPAISHDNRKIVDERDSLKTIIESHLEAFKNQIALIELHIDAFGYKK